MSNRKVMQQQKTAIETGRGGGNKHSGVHIKNTREKRRGEIIFFFLQLFSFLLYRSTKLINKYK